MWILKEIQIFQNINLFIFIFIEIMIVKIQVATVIGLLLTYITALKITGPDHELSDPQAYLDALSTQQAEFEAGIAVL